MRGVDGRGGIFCELFLHFLDIYRQHLCVVQVSFAHLEIVHQNKLFSGTDVHSFLLS